MNTPELLCTFSKLFYLMLANQILKQNLLIPIHLST
jgi:hypothetical protein